MHRVQNLSIDIELVRAFRKQIQPRHRRRTDIAKRTWGSSVGVKAPEIVLHFSGTSFAGHLVFEFQPNGRLPFLVALTFVLKDIQCLCRGPSFFARARELAS